MLPGIAFESVPRALDESLPRMDVCGFVGFASRGPIDVPVLIEGTVAFRDVFGPDFEVARTDDGTPVRAHLGTAVDAFFANGGRRAWVVRAARTGEGGAVTNHFAMPGLVVPGDNAAAVAGWQLATLAARSPGAWSDGLTAGASLEVTSAVGDVNGPSALIVDHGADAIVGDLVAIAIAEGRSVLAVVRRVQPVASGKLIEIDLSTARLLTETPPAPGAAHCLGADGPTPIPSFAVDAADPSDPIIVVAVGEPVADGDVLLVEGVDAAGLLSIVVGAERFDHTESAIRRFATERSTLITAAPDDWPDLAEQSPPGPVVIEVQRLRLHVRDGESIAAELAGLGLSASHSRALTDLPPDARIYPLLANMPRTDAPDGSDVIGVAQLADRALTGLEQDCLAPRFPLAGPVGAGPLLPYGVTTDPTAVVFGAAPREAISAPTPKRNGLGTFDAAVFIDPALAALGTDTIMPAAWDLTHVQHPPRRLRGVHALTTNDDVTLVCVPDAVHTGWDPISIEPPRPLTAPELSIVGEDDTGVHLSWSPVGTATGYVIEHASTTSFEGAARLASANTEATVAVRQLCPALTFHRVRAERGDEIGPWSNVVAGVVPASTFAPCDPIPAELAAAESPRAPAEDQVVWRARTAPEAAPWNELRAVQTAVLRWCAARGDVLAVLALPGAFTADATLRHVDVLRGAATEPGDDAGSTPFLAGGVPALTPSERVVLGYGALHHPWPVVGWPSDEGEIRAVPPDGGVAGTYAARAIDRGAWVAPGRRPLVRTLALQPTIEDDRLLPLSLSGVNPIAADPSGFMALTASTMSDESATRPVNVRRLIMLLRRLARREGVGIVFEPNDRELARLVHMRFERLLSTMFQRGAFAGATASEAFEVSTGSNVNPPEAVDAGRFAVVVRIAPSRPLEFITIRLVVAGNATGEART